MSSAVISTHSRTLSSLARLVLFSHYFLHFSYSRTSPAILSYSCAVRITRCHPYFGGLGGFHLYQCAVLFLIAVRRKCAHLGRKDGQVSAHLAGALGPRYSRAFQPGRVAHRVLQLRRPRPHLGHCIRAMPQNTHRCPFLFSLLLSLFSLHSIFILRFYFYYACLPLCDSFCTLRF